MTDNTNNPTSLDLLIRDRLDDLPNDLQQIIQVAAVLGAPFDAVTLSAVCKRDIRSSLEELATRKLVRRESENSHWSFHHPLIESVAYENIPSDKRQAIHQSMVDLLEARYTGCDNDHTERLAYHLHQANQNDRALNHLVSAGECAAAKSANEQACQYFEQALEILSVVPDTFPSLRYRLATGLGDTYREMGRYKESMAALRTCMGLMETGRLDPLERAGLYRRMGNTARKQGEYQTASNYFKAAKLILRKPDTPDLQKELSRVLLGTAWAQFHQGLFDTARETAEKGLVYAEAAESIVDMAALENLLGGIYYSQSDWAVASQHTHRAMLLRKEMGYTRGVASTLGNLGVLAILEGDWDKAKSFFEESLSMRDTLDAEGLALVHNNLGNLFRDQGKLSIAENHYRESLDASASFTHSYHSANATLGLASVLFLKEDPNNAQMALTQALQIAEEIGANDVITEARRVEVEILIAEGKLKPAFKTAQLSLQQAKETGNRNHQVSLWRLISTIELAEGHIDVAKNALEQAQELLSDVTDMLELGRTHAQAARIAQTLGDQSAVKIHLQQAQDTFKKLGAEMDIAQLQQIAENQNRKS